MHHRKYERLRKERELKKSQRARQRRHAEAQVSGVDVISVERDYRNDFVQVKSAQE